MCGGGEGGSCSSPLVFNLGASAFDSLNGFLIFSRYFFGVDFEYFCSPRNLGFSCIMQSFEFGVIEVLEDCCNFDVGLVCSSYLFFILKGD